MRAVKTAIRFEKATFLQANATNESSFHVTEETSAHSPEQKARSMQHTNVVANCENLVSCFKYPLKFPIFSNLRTPSN